ncbi:MAG: TlpA family protein disulfide reductase, partial [Marinirhabdus sp.]
GAQNYVLVFWSSSCSHCLKEMPQLQKLMNAQRAGKYKVVAVGVEEDGYAWKNETTRYPKFEHVLTLGRWENEIVRMYDVAHTPTYFVLDANKTIVAKPDDFDGLIDYVEANK